MSRMSRWKAFRYLEKFGRCLPFIFDTGLKVGSDWVHDI